MTMLSLKQQPPPTCLICLEAQDTPPQQQQQQQLVSLCDASCHKVCRDCFKNYLVHCEDDRKNTVVCPHPNCSSHVSRDTMRTVLGRDYCPKVWEITTKEEKLDQDLSEWLRDNEARECMHCHAWIVREDGCDAMQCLCGWRFCWECRTPVKNYDSDNDDDDDDEGFCSCGFGHDEFYDNVLEREGTRPPKQLATTHDLEHFAAFSEQRRARYNSDSDDYDRWDSDSDWEEYEEESCVWIGSIFDNQEDAFGVFDGTFLEYEEPADDGVSDATFFDV
mmetsp:Transcript_2825/g.4093  ORF Transcript_2825/g.4093 Transcript_2825/m.4093 type:complete len:277 (-) Transcript_2825:410-1240(-)